MTIMIPAWVKGELQPVEKLEVHELGLRHKAVSVFVLRGNLILLQQRASTKYHTPGLWANTCCTHPNWDENPRDCAVRRLREELGISGLTPEFCTQLEYRADVGGGLVEHEEVDVFCAHAPAKLQMAPNPDEVSATRWVSLETLQKETRDHPERFTPWIRIYVADHASKIFDEVGQPA
ncbi:MAG: isopentenyl-diphosphate Delta-isomerase [Pseudomonadota bacterium]